MREICSSTEFGIMIKPHSEKMVEKLTWQNIGGAILNTLTAKNRSVNFYATYSLCR